MCDILTNDTRTHPSTKRPVGQPFEHASARQNECNHNVSVMHKSVPTVPTAIFWPTNHNRPTLTLTDLTATQMAPRRCQPIHPTVGPTRQKPPPLPRTFSRRHQCHADRIRRHPPHTIGCHPLQHTGRHRQLHALLPRHLAPLFFQPVGLLLLCTAAMPPATTMNVTSPPAQFKWSNKPNSTLKLATVTLPNLMRPWTKSTLNHFANAGGTSSMPPKPPSKTQTGLLPSLPNASPNGQVHCSTDF